MVLFARQSQNTLIPFYFHDSLFGRNPLVPRSSPDRVGISPLRYEGVGVSPEKTKPRRKKNERRKKKTLNNPVMPLHTRRKPSHGGQIATNEALLLTTDGAHRISDAVRQGTDTHTKDQLSW